MRGIKKSAFLLGAVLILLSGGCPFFAPPGTPTDLSASDGEYPEQSGGDLVLEPGGLPLRGPPGPSRAGPYELLRDVTGTSYDDTQVAVGTTYWYRVRACNAQGCGPASVADSGYPGGALAQVTGFKATTLQPPSFQVTLTWNPCPTNRP